VFPDILSEIDSMNKTKTVICLSRNKFRLIELEKKDHIHRSDIYNK
jgi:hypothetical protein